MVTWSEDQNFLRHFKDFWSINFNLLKNNSFDLLIPPFKIRFSDPHFFFATLTTYKNCLMWSLVTFKKFDLIFHSISSIKIRMYIFILLLRCCDRTSQRRAQNPFKNKIIFWREKSGKETFLQRYHKSASTNRFI